MGIRKGLGLAAAAVLGAAVAILPAAASSESTPAIEAENPGVYEHRWSRSEVTVGEGGALLISNNTSVIHGVVWKEGPEAPTCEHVPVGAGQWATNWSGSCTFKKAGTYVFWCSVHGAEMKATVTVTPATTTTGTTGTPGGTTGTVPGGGGGGGASTSPTASPLASPPTSAITTVKVRSRQRGHAVSGSVNVSGAAPGRLEVDLLAKRASLASARSSLLRVGRILRPAVGPGPVTFKVPLSAAGRRALARAGRLVLVVQITLTPRSGSAVVVKRTVSLHA